VLAVMAYSPDVAGSMSDRFPCFTVALIGAISVTPGSSVLLWGAGQRPRVQGRGSFWSGHFDYGIVAIVKFCPQSP
jgi:hypothetical protein